MTRTQRIAGDLTGNKSKSGRTTTQQTTRNNQELDKIVQNTLLDHGVSKPACVGVMQKSEEPHAAFSAFTTIHDEKVHVEYDPEYQLSKRAKKYCRQKNVEDGLEKCLEHIPGHECRHIKNKKVVGCPGTVEEHEYFFYAPMAKVLVPKKKDWALDDVTNLAEDLINNTLGSATKSHAGLTLFYGNCGDTIGWSQGMEFYMGVQQYCWQDEHDRWLLSPHYKHDKKVVKATKEFIEWIEQKASKGKRATKEQLVEYFSSKNNWESIATEFAKKIEPFIKENFAPPMCAHGKQMQKEMSSPTTRKKMAKKYYDEGKEKPPWMEQTEALDAVYTIIAKEVPLIVDQPQKNQSYPMIPVQHRPYDEEHDKIQKVNFYKPIIIPEKETPFGVEGLTFGVARQHVDIPLHVRQSIARYPKFKQMYLDVSISMTEGIPNTADPGNKTFIPWGDKSKYHYAVLTRYGIIEYLARQGILPNVEVSLAIFSSYNKIVRGLEESTQLILNPQFGGSTNMDIETFRTLAGEEKAVLFTSSDGAIQNWTTIKKEFIEIAKQHHYFHLQWGEETTMTRDLRNAGLTAITTKSGEEHYQLAIDLTKKQIENHVQEYTEIRGGI